MRSTESGCQNIERLIKFDKRDRKGEEEEETKPIKYAYAS